MQSLLWFLEIFCCWGVSQVPALISMKIQAELWNFVCDAEFRVFLFLVFDGDSAVILSRLRAKPVRTASGIAVVAVMSKPHRCPHIATTGNICVYCPGGPDSDFEYSTQSYTGYEPTSMRAIRARWLFSHHSLNGLKFTILFLFKSCFNGHQLCDINC